MPYVTTVEDASAHAIQVYLAAELAASGYSVVTAWPSPDERLSAGRVSIITAGAPEEECFDPYVLSSVVVDSLRKNYTWAVSGLVIPMQLDCWATSDVMRSDMAKQIRTALKRGAGYTLGVFAGDPFAQGALLPLASGYTGTVFVSAEPPDTTNTSDAVQRNEYRARFDLECTTLLTETTTSPRMASIKGRVRISKLAVPVGGTWDNTTTTTTSGTTWTKNTP